MEHTGHRRLDGVRSYKYTSDKQRETLSNILNNPSHSSLSGPLVHSTASEKQSSNSQKHMNMNMAVNMRKLHQVTIAERTFYFHMWFSVDRVRQ